MTEKKHGYFRNVFVRTNVVKQFFLGAMFQICSWPRLVLEVFIRRNMGERYYNIASASFVFVILFTIPFLSNSANGMSGFQVVYYNPFWYIYLAAYLYCSIQRWKEIRRNPSVFDFGRFSLSSGDILPFFDKLKYKGKLIDPRTLETIVEPLPFFIAGFLLLVIGQYNIGLLLMGCAFIYGASYMGAYYLGDMQVMDTIDHLIVNEAAKKFYMDGSSEKGVRFRNQRPADPDLGNKIIKNLFSDTEDDDPPSFAS